MSSIFQQIIDGELPCYRIAENEKFLSFLDIRPIKTGHTLVIPKQEVDYIFDMDDRQLCEFILFAKDVAKQIGKAIECKKVGMMVAGLEVPHAHIHLVPIDDVNDLNFANAKEADPDDLNQIASLIVEAASQ